MTQLSPPPPRLLLPRLTPREPGLQPYPVRPGGLMDVHDATANPPSDLLVEVRRAAPRRTLEPLLPEPLAEPVLDLRIDAASARAYEVKKGQYVQIIDVEGRQCSDFLAFASQQLQHGVE